MMRKRPTFSGMSWPNKKWNLTPNLTHKHQKIAYLERNEYCASFHMCLCLKKMKMQFRIEQELHHHRMVRVNQLIVAPNVGHSTMLKGGQCYSLPVRNRFALLPTNSPTQWPSSSAHSSIGALRDGLHTEQKCAVWMPRRGPSRLLVPLFLDIPAFFGTAKNCIQSNLNVRIRAY